MLNIGVLISGRGSNLQALLDACSNDFPARIVTVISNKADAAGLLRAEKAGVKTQVIDHKKYPDRETFDRALDQALRNAGVDMVCLAGFMRILTPWFVDQWKDKLINIHPSLLPEFPGVDTHARALKAGVKQTGCTVHFVRADVDTGPIIVQAAVPVLPDDTEDTLAARVLTVEHLAYPFAVQMIASGKAKLVNGKVVFDPSVKMPGWAQ